MTGNTDLSIEDVEFLQAVRYIESNPDEFDDDSETVGATTQSVRQLLEKRWSTSADWTKPMISYRMNGPDKSSWSRGWGMDHGFGLVKLHEATMTQDGWTRREIELTQKGRKWLSRKEEQMNLTRSEGRGDGAAEIDSSEKQLELELQSLEEEIEELREENDELRSTLEMVVDDLSRIKESETGALDGNISDQLQGVFTRVVRQNRVNAMVLGIDTEPFSPPGDPSEEQIVETRSELFETISPQSRDE